MYRARIEFLCRKSLAPRLMSGRSPRLGGLGLPMALGRRRSLKLGTGGFHRPCPFHIPVWDFFVQRSSQETAIALPAVTKIKLSSSLVISAAVRTASSNASPWMIFGLDYHQYEHDQYDCLKCKENIKLLLSSYSKTEFSWPPQIRSIRCHLSQNFQDLFG